MKMVIDKIRDPVWRAFAWRVYNTFVASIGPFVLLPILLHVQNSLQEAGDLSCFWDGQFWAGLGFVAIAALVTSLIAGLNKVNRMEDDSL